MTVSTVTSKGQVTIPKEVRDKLGLRSGDKVDFIIRDGSAVFLRPCKKAIGDLRGILKGKHKLSIEEMDDAIADFHSGRSGK